MIARFIATMLCLFVAGLALADHCAAPVRVVQHQQYHAPTYHQQAYYPPHYVPVHISPDYYYSTSNYYAQKLQAEATAAETVKLLADAIRLGQAFQVQPQPQIQLAPLIQQPAAPPQVKGTPVNPAFANLVATRCLKCHSGADAKAGLDFSNLSTVAKGLRKRMLSAVCTGDMPPQQELTHEEISLFRAYYKASE